MNRLPVILLAVLSATAAYATTYVRVEKDGTKTYSDRPIPGGVPIELTPAQSYSSPEPRIATPTGSGPLEQSLLEQMDNFRYTSCEITPQNDTTFTNPDTVSVSVNLMPSLRGDHSVQVTVDGVPIAGGQNAMSTILSNVFRGSHTVAVTVKNRYGQSLCSSSATFHVLRPSLNSPARRPRT